MNLASPRPTLGAAIRIAARDPYLYLILVAFLALATAWNFTSPIFETPDEAQHLQYIVFVANEGRRPNLWTEVEQAGTASFESPLYYLLTGTFLRVSGLAYTFNMPRRNPEFSFDPRQGASNYYLPTVANYDYVHVLRGVSALFGLVTVACTYLVAGLLGGKSALRLSATAFTAFLPQFTFISGALNNDTLATAIASVGFVWLLAMYNSRVPGAWQGVVFGVLCGLGLLSKPHTLYLVPSGALLFLFSPRLSWRQLFALGTPALIGFSAVAGWYLADNYWRYGDPLAIRMQALMLPEQVNPKKMTDLIELPALLYISFLGVFGWMRIFLPAILYSIFATLCIFAFIGNMIRILRRDRGTGSIFLLVPPLIIFVALVYYNLTFDSNQGRYFFPALGAISLLFMFGTSQLPHRFARTLLIGMPLFLFITNLYSIWLVWSSFSGLR